jgi:hypothetical protein
MIMVLPLVIALVTILCILNDWPKAGLWAWVLLIGVYLAWCRYHMTDALAISL